MNRTYIERFELLGYEIDVCTSMKKFTEKIKEMCSWNPYGEVTFKTYMNGNITGYYNSISEGFCNPDACIFIQYKDGKTYSYYPALGTEGEFKETGIEWAIISHDYGYITYKNDLSAEWEFLELDEDEKEAIELGISLEDYKKIKKTAERFHPTEEPEAEEQEATPAEETAKSTENSADDTTEEPETEEQEATPAEETAKSTENSAEEATEEVTEEPEAEEQEATPAEKTANNTELNGFRYKINILDTLKKAGYTSTRIRENHLFAQVTLQKFRKGDTNISLQTVADICYFTRLQPWDIIEYWEATKEEADETARKHNEESKKELEKSRKLMEEIKQKFHLKGTENSVEEVTEETTKK